MLKELRAGGRQVLGILNKVDTLEPAEQEELSAYLRDQLGDVLVDIIPLSATRALEHRLARAGFSVELWDGSVPGGEIK